MSKKVLVIVTNVDEFDKVGFRTGLWFSELAYFWNVVEKAGYDLEIASPLGGKVPLDPQSLIIPHIVNATGLSGNITRRYKDKEFHNLLNHTKKISEVHADDYDAIYLTGGHGVMFDYPNSKSLAALISQFYEEKKIVASVCHGAAGLLNVKLRNGEYLIKGKKLTAFSWKEEKLARIHKAVPYNLEEELKKRGAIYRSALLPFGTHVLQDGQLVTGQNPKSTKKVGEIVVKMLEKKQQV